MLKVNMEVLMVPRKKRSPNVQGPLLNLLTEKFPIAHNDRGALNIVKLAELAGYSYENIYRWLRKNKLSTKGRDTLLKVAATKDNLDLLEAGGTNPLTKSELNLFI
ncbi:hypothetical protein [Alterisphingorhabdus coralli]|uniref:Uncharacterized protein n=1 Tax=Alterisphingorhabdus coralli TaxID=3071408 RepID=A0AA97F9C4_9SPHN|nr:hypothetical protein [Parasphingorhabdus sp. SCSIO 66989]WOE76363.1 hypothetical protein RB602_06520 [Parasphingorhabdus sp. SCSIO 66989]